jgi:hypothetical protein
MTDCRMGISHNRQLNASSPSCAWNGAILSTFYLRPFRHLQQSLDIPCLSALTVRCILMPDKARHLTAKR